MWASPQMMAPYGSPYAAMYPHAGIYGPSATPVVATALTLETPSRSGNDSGSGNKPKESDVRPASGYGNSNSNGSTVCPDDGGVRESQSTDCGTEGSCDRSDNSITREDNRGNNNGVSNPGTCYGQMLPFPSVDANAVNGIGQGIQLASLKPVGNTPMPTLQDERELKHKKRKQSNRESARRSRLRKQAEKEELGGKVDSLTVENIALISEITKLVEDSEKLKSENAALMERLNNKQGQAGEMACDKIDEQEKKLLSAENLLSRVNNSVANGDNERGNEENQDQKAMML